MIRRLSAIGFVLLSASISMAAQGGSPSKPTSAPPGQSKRPTAPPGSIGHGKGTFGRTRLPLPPAGGVGSPTSRITLASWLDDADTLEPGTISLGLSAGYSESLDGSETDAPAAEVAFGIAKDVQISGSVPYYRATYDDGYQSSGLGNTYLSGKWRAIDPNRHTVGIAVEPVVEILSDAAVADPTLGIDRVNWALPISFQVSRGSTEVFATAGYFSRGAVFAAAGVAEAVSSRLTLTAAVSHMYSTHSDVGTDLEGLSRSRTDATGSVAIHVTPALSIAAGAGRTVSSLDQNGSRLLASASISYALSPHHGREAGGASSSPASLAASR